ncbi:MAG: ferritin-like domain-containing protein [Gemmatimonadetes bacterium]|nr:ferritin-like domain-containing protein [Gemmatimonadota bacterium]
MDKLTDLNDLFQHELKDLYSAEQQILKVLPKMADATSHDELRRAFQEHEQVTREQVRRLETIADDLGFELKGTKCKGIEGILDEGKDVLKADADPSTRDAALIGQAQRVEHYEIAGYGTARTYARRLGYDRAAELLQTTLEEEGNTDQRLTQLAESLVNPDAHTQRMR